MTGSRRLPQVLLACCIVLSAVCTTFAQQYPESSYQEMRWRMIGPFRGGRTRAVSGVASQPNVFYMGQVNGGVWKSDDYGRTWAPIFDSQPTQSIGAIAVAPSDPNVIYVASGEGLHRPDLSVGDGIYKSTDAGKTWTHLGLRGGQQIPALVVDPRDPNRLVAAVLGHPYGPSDERGIYRSTDGGNTWKKVLSKDENTGGSDVEIDPSNPDTLYASLWEAREGPWEDRNLFNGTSGGLFKSTDGGETWRPLTKGLPTNLAQINVAIAPSDPKRLYATLATAATGDLTAQLGVYRSDDAGENWYHVTTDPRPGMRIGGGDLPVPKVDPKNPDVVYSTSTVTMKSTDGAKTWVSFRGAPGGDDYQNIWINPRDPNTILLVSDQGAIVTVNGGKTWGSWYNQPTAQLYHAITTNTFPYKVCGGQQESGSVCISSRGNDGEVTFRDWHPVGVIEYGYVAPDPLDPDVIYGAGRSEVSRFHWSTGQVQNVTPIPVRDGKYRADRTEPIMFSPLNPHVMYYAANVLFKTTDGGENWQTISPDLTRENPGAPASVGKLFPAGSDKQRGVIYALAASFKNENILWTGTDDGQVWRTADGGKNWNNITPPDITPWSKVTQISASHYGDDTAYISVSRFRIDDLRPYIFRTRDGGKTWQSITAGLPQDAPVDTVREDPERKGLLFAGTEKAVWVSFDDGDHWQSLQLNLPHTSMRDLWIHDNDLVVATHGRAFWILDDISPLRQMAASVVQSDAYLFRPGRAYRVRRSTNSDTPLPPDEPAGLNPPDGAIVDYFLAKSASGFVMIEIRDAQGKLVRKYSSTDRPEITAEELKKQLIPIYWVGMQGALASGEGMHRWTWDLRYPSPTSTRHEYPIAAIAGRTPREPLGPYALPGKYTVRLTVNGHSYTAPLMVEMDPRVKTSSAGLEQMFQLETRLASLLTRSSEAVMQARSMHQQAQAVAGKATGSVADAVKSFDHKLTEALEGTGQPGATKTLSAVNDIVSSLYSDAGRADAAPSRVLLDAASAAEQETAAALNSFDNLRITDLAALNQALRGAGLSEIQAKADSLKADDSADVE